MPSISEDRDEIRTLLARYCLYFDQGDAEGWAGLYAQDGEFVGGGRHLKGRAEMLAFFGELGADRMHRVTVNHVIDVDGDHAVCRSSVLLLDNGVIANSGRAVDELERVDGSWVIVRRTFEADAAT